MYTKEDHFLVKLLTNNAMQLEEEIKEKEKTIKSLMKANTDLHKNYNILKEKYDNAVRMLHSTEPVKQEVVTQPNLFETIESEGSSTVMTVWKPFDKTTKSNDLTPHFRMQPTRRRLTTEQAQHAWNMITMGNARMTDIAKKFNCTEGTIHNIISGVSYKEINRSKQ